MPVRTRSLLQIPGIQKTRRAGPLRNHDPSDNMSNATQQPRKSGEGRRRRSRGGRNRNKQQTNRRSGDQGAREGRPQESRGKRGPRKPVKLTWWQKLLKAVGLYKEPARPERAKERTTTVEKPPKSNVRNARGNGGAKPATEPATRGSRGGDPKTVESSRVYVGNLSYDVTEQDLQELFKGVGGVRGVEIVYNRTTHRSKGYGFVEMLHKDEAVRAVEVLHDQPFMGRKLVVSGAKSKGRDEREDQEEDGGDEHIVSLAPLPAASAEPAIETIVEEAPSDDSEEETERRSEVA